MTRGRALGVRAARTLTVEAYARRWLGEFIDTAADIDRYRRGVAEHIVPGLGSRPFVEVTTAEIAALLEQVSVIVSPTEAEQLQATLRGPFSDAVDDGIIARSPVPASLRAASGPAHP